MRFVSAFKLQIYFQEKLGTDEIMLFKYTFLREANLSTGCHTKGENITYIQMAKSNIPEILFSVHAFKQACNKAIFLSANYYHLLDYVYCLVSA